MKSPKVLFKPLLVAFLLVALVLPVIPAQLVYANPSWWDTDWKYKTKFTMNNADQGELTGFTTLVRLNSARVDFDLIKADGADIRFVDADDSTPITGYDIEKWDDTAEEAVIHVAVPTVTSASSADFFYMYYGNAAASDNQDKDATWDANYVFVSHMDDTTTSTITDVSGADNDGTKESANNPIVTTSGKIGDAQVFSSGDFINLGSAASLDDLGNHTIEAWIYIEHGGVGRVYAKSKLGVENDKYELYHYQWDIYYSRDYITTDLLYQSDDDNNLTTATWEYVASIQTNLTAKLYLSGDEVTGYDTETPGVGALASDASSTAFLGKRDYGASPGWFVGTMDEVRVSNIARSEDYMAAQYLSMTDTFLTYGAMETFAPTVTTQAATNIGSTTATGHGNITATGENCDIRGIVWDLASHGDPGDVSPAVSDYANDVDETGSFGTGAFTRSLTGLPTSDTIYCRAYAHNSAGYAYGAEVNFLTTPAAPTNVAATDGVHTDKVVVTWTKSTGGTGYKVYEGVNLLDTLGDVATYDDTAAPAGIITPGTSTASDGTGTAHVTLSLAGESVADGVTRTYKVVAFNATGDSDDSNTNTGYRTTGSITYQWQRTPSDSPSGMGNITGATTDPYNDTGAPSDGSGRWFRCAVSATGATIQYSTSNRGYRGPPSAPTGFSATTVSGTQIDLEWTIGVLSSKTLIVSKIGSYPANRSDGTSVYFGTGAEFSDLGLDPRTAYYYRIWAYSTGSADYSATYAEDAVVTSSTEPDATTKDATLITRSTARLNAFLDDDGGAGCEAIFEWNTDSGAPYAHQTDWVAGYATNQAIWATIEDLEAGTTYYYRVKVRNYAGTVVGLEKSFIAQLYLGNPTDLLARASSAYSISLSWVSGEGSSQTIIRYDTGGYPASYTDGSSAYAGAEQTCLVEGLEPGTTYFIRAWAKDGEYYSPSYTYDLATTLAGSPAPAGAAVPTAPERWWQATDSTNLINVPLYDAINNLSSTLGWTNDFGWMVVSLLLTTIIGYAVIQITHSALIMVAVVSFAILVSCIMEVLPMWILVPLVLIDGGIAYMRRRA